MTPIIATVNTATMSSVELVDFINSERKKDAERAGVSFPSKGFAKLEHADFMKKVPEVLGGNAGNFSGIYCDTRNREQVCYNFPKREACLMAMSYSYDLQAKVFDKMTALEAQPSTPTTLSTLDILQIAMESEKGRLLAIEQRDHAIATKAQIGDKKVATAMATASAKSRENAKLKDRLGFSARHATILQVEDAAGGDFDFLPLRRWCKANEVIAESVPDKRYPKGVKAWPAAAWMAVQVKEGELIPGTGTRQRFGTSFFLPRPAPVIPFVRFLMRLREAAKAGRSVIGVVA